MLKVRAKMLLLAAAVVWLLAGASVVYAGVTASAPAWTGGTAAIFAVVYVLFIVMFLLISRKQINRIRGYQNELVKLFRLFDANSYILLVIMVGFGTAVRLSGMVPASLISPFYSGLGLALLTAAVHYLVTYVATCDELLNPKSSE